MTPRIFSDFNAKELFIWLKQKNTRIENEEENANFRTSLICATIANFSANKRKGKNYKPSDFIKSKQNKKKKRLTPEQMLHNLKRITKAFGGHIAEGV